MNAVMTAEHDGGEEIQTEETEEETHENGED